MANYGFGPLTLVLICISVAVFLLSKSGGGTVQTVPWLFISEYRIGLPEIQGGQLWRLVTPMFIHFDFLHVFFNMLWLRDLGGMIEGRQNSLQLAILIFAIAAVSNLAQYYAAGPMFGGMSGVVYGLVGYIWTRGRYDPGSGLFLHPSTVVMASIWFLVCLVGWVGYAANAAHGAGLCVGIAWGYLSSLRYR